MDPRATLLALLVGLVQGVLEWLPVSSEGGVALVVALSTGESAFDATQFALFLHAGTAAAGFAFYREEAVGLLGSVPEWRPRDAFGTDRADLTFYGVASLVSGVVGLSLYAVLSEAATELAGGAFVAAVGALLVGTGLLQRAADRWGLGERATPDAADAVVVGICQGLALLPGVSRSGTTVSALLLRGHGGERALQLSFLLSIPASLGAGLLVVVDEGVPTVPVPQAMLALGVSAVVGYVTVGALVALVRRVAFWGVCVGFGALAVLGGGLLVAAENGWVAVVQHWSFAVV
ncbi:undecaprenyl-diphosphate phosphatase [Halosimplex litoreum]|uniref:Undecaprenyl-diphosphatase n=1 Tax=Halosimplex litoreum TaxID=1198301 RepID=A0A7T3G171_9EURY|nr:undecaprenyl-diphosphate phosphatase [Halosimplex litoreum]QPV64480.1 undecaprenyl-diphosphate phosphatase [Halosimplex litoreum]